MSRLLLGRSQSCSEPLVTIALWAECNNPVGYTTVRVRTNAEV
jgi:hypothetical protein